MAAAIWMMVMLNCSSVYSAKWEWINPSPQGYSLNNVWAHSSDNVFAVGYSAVILHYDGTHWSLMNHPLSDTNVEFKEVWGSAPDDVYVVGGDYNAGGIILHYDGSAWKQIQTSVTVPLSAVWGSAADDVFVVGYWGTILHFDGSAWYPMTEKEGLTLNGVWGTGPADVFAVGDYGLVLHYDGNKWEKQTEMHNPLDDVWGSSGSDVYAVGWNGQVLHYDGNKWEDIESPVFAQFYGVWGSSSSDVYITGDNGRIIHFDGTSWSEVKNESGATGVDIFGTSATDIFAVGWSGVILHFDGVSWKETTSAIPITNNLDGLWVNTLSDMFATGANGTIIHFDGTAWTSMENPLSGTDTYLFDIWASGENDVYVVGALGTILHYDGTEWKKMETGMPESYIRGIWGVSPNSIFAVGGSGLILHYNGKSWQSMDSGTLETFNAIWGTSETDIYAVGYTGTIYHYDGRAWQPAVTLTADPAMWNSQVYLRGIWGTAPDNIYVAGGYSGRGGYGYGIIFHYDGNTWTRKFYSVGLNQEIMDIKGLSGDEMYAVGGGIFLRYDGNQWSRRSVPRYSGLSRIQPIAPGKVMAVGDQAKILTFDESLPSKGFDASSDLWIRAVIHTEEKGPIEAIWKKRRETKTERGDTVIWGYFYADAQDVSWGSEMNPEVFVKIWYDVSGRVDVNYVYVSVPDITVYSDYPLDGTADVFDTMTLSKRYVRHYYYQTQAKSEFRDEDGQSIPGTVLTGNPSGYALLNGLKIGGIIHTVEKGAVDAVWQEGGRDTTQRGDQVIWGHFYADPKHVAWGSPDNPEIFLKIWYDVGGRVDVNYFHVSVPDIDVYSAMPDTGFYHQKGACRLENRYIRHSF